jgi:hypothetical protein
MIVELSLFFLVSTSETSDSRVALLQLITSSKPGTSVSLLRFRSQKTIFFLHFVAPVQLATLPCKL